MTPADWWNGTRYRLYAPVYGLVASPLERSRERAIDRLDLGPDDRILILGCGPGVDLEYLPAGAAITAIDIMPAMVERTARADELGLDVDARVGDAQSLPFEDDSSTSCSSTWSSRLSRTPRRSWPRRRGSSPRTVTPPSTTSSFPRGPTPRSPGGSSTRWPGSCSPT